MVVKEVILTPAGHKKLKAEIEHLSTVKRREVAERIKQAREFGDIAENSEYDDAKNEQAMLEHRIATLEERSNESPVGKAIIGRKKGETVDVTAPRGSLKYKIMDIQAA
jgi:transcription elongation GreA/GreB family factor